MASLNVDEKEVDSVVNEDAGAKEEKDAGVKEEKKKREYKCSICGLSGHNKVTCTEAKKVSKK